jgi:P27 family predicted phage terminase small subunit
MTAGRKSRHANLKLVEGRSEGRDSGGRKIPKPPAFIRIPPEKPEHLSKHASELWDRIVDELPRLGLLKELDGSSLEMLCEAYALWRDAVDKRHRLGSVSKTNYGFVIAPWVRIEVNASKEFRSWCSEFGLSPAAEMKLAGPSAGTGEPNDNPFAGSG